MAVLKNKASKQKPTKAITNVGEDSGQKGTVRPLWKSAWRFLKKLKSKSPYSPATLLLGIFPKGSTSTHYGNTYRSTFIPALLSVSKLSPLAQHPSIDEWIKKMCFISAQWSVVRALNRTELCHLPENGWKIIILNKISQNQEGNYCMFSLLCRT